MAFEIGGISFDPEGSVSIQYLEIPADVRLGGKAAMTRSLNLAPNPEYADALEDVERAIQRLLKDVLEDFHDSEPYQPDDEELDPEHDDAPVRGMGD